MTDDEPKEKPAPPKLVWKKCDWCRGTGKWTDRETCGMCEGYGGWWAMEKKEGKP